MTKVNIFLSSRGRQKLKINFEEAITGEYRTSDKGWVGGRGALEGRKWINCFLSPWATKRPTALSVAFVAGISPVGVLLLELLPDNELWKRMEN